MGIAAKVEEEMMLFLFKGAGLLLFRIQGRDELDTRPVLFILVYNRRPRCYDQRYKEIPMADRRGVLDF